MDVLKKIPHRHFVFSLPKILRRYFLYDRKLLAALSRCAWESLKVFMQQAVPEKEPLPGAVIAVQTFGDFLGFNPHCHILLTDGCFYGERGMSAEERLQSKNEFETLLLERITGQGAIDARRLVEQPPAASAATASLTPIVSGGAHGNQH